MHQTFKEVRVRAFLGLVIFAIINLNYCALTSGLIAKNGEGYYLYLIFIRILSMFFIKQHQDQDRERVYIDVLSLMRFEIFALTFFLTTNLLNSYTNVEILLFPYRWLYEHRVIAIFNSFFLLVYILRIFMPDRFIDKSHKSITFYAIASFISFCMGIHVFDNSDKYMVVLSLSVVALSLFVADCVFKVRNDSESLLYMRSDVRDILSDAMTELAVKYREKS